MSLHELVWSLGRSSGAVNLPNEFAAWAPGDAIPQSGDRLLIGVAEWSIYDQQLLSLLESLPHRDCRIDLFSANDCNSQEAIRDFIPQIGFVHHTPIVGYWRDGKLVESANGYSGRHLIYRVLGLDAAHADQVVLRRRVSSTV